MIKLVRFYKNNKAIAFILAFVLVILIVLLFVNFKNTDFYEAKITELITIFFGGIIAFFITEKTTDNRRRNDCIEHIIVEIEAMISDDENFMIGMSTLLKQASCANRIKYLKDASFNDIKEDIEFIDQHFSEIRDLYSNHSSCGESLTSVRVDIDRHRDQIVDKCSKIRVELYK